MIPNLVCGLTLMAFYILQITIFSRITLISGAPDLILLFLIAWSLQERVKNNWFWAVVAGVLISIGSAMPFYTPLIGYFGVVSISNIFQRKIWRNPLMVMFVVTFLGTFFQHTVYIIGLILSGAPVTWMESLDSVTIPSILLNLIFALPIYAIVNDLAGRLYPLEVEA